MMAPTLPPVIINAAITSVYKVIAVCMPLMVVPRSSATYAIDTFMTELSRAIRNWPVASMAKTVPLPETLVAVAVALWPVAAAFIVAAPSAQIAIAPKEEDRE
jgi:hypothetical protein